MEVVAGALRALVDFVGAAPQFDDITALSVRYRLDGFPAGPGLSPVGALPGSLPPRPVNSPEYAFPLRH